MSEMTHIEQLEALIQRAIEREYLRSDHTFVHKPDGLPITSIRTMVDGICEDHLFEPLALIFDHDFARALFGEELAMFAAEEDVVGKFKFKMFGLTWAEYHLQQAVISEDPIGYMYEEVFK